MVFVITDGASSDKTKTASAAKFLRNKGVTVFAIGIAGAKQDELENMASNKSLIFTYNDFNKLGELQDVFLNQTCQGEITLL